MDLVAKRKSAISYSSPSIWRAFSDSILKLHSNIPILSSSYAFKIWRQTQPGQASASPNFLKMSLKFYGRPPRKGNVLRPARKLNDEVPPPAKIPPLPLVQWSRVASRSDIATG